MATFRGVISHALPEQSGMSKSGNPWRKRTFVLTYDQSNANYPKAVVFDVINDNLAKLNLQPGCEYEVEIDFSVREYQGRYYQSASAWKATPAQPVTAPQPPTPPAQQNWQAAYQQPTATPQPQCAPPQGNDDLPF